MCILRILNCGLLSVLVLNESVMFLPMNGYCKSALPNIIRKRILKLRDAHGLTQDMLCDLAEISLDSVSRIEGGKRVPSLDTLEKIAAAFNINVAELLSTESVPQTEYPPSLMRIIHLLSKQAPQVHEACEKLLRTTLKSFLDPTIAQEVIAGLGPALRNSRLVSRIE